MNPNEALGLPRGSVRAIIALLLIIGALALLFAGIEVPEWHRLAIAAAIGMYFSKRDRQPPSPPAVQISPRADAALRSFDAAVETAL